MDEGALSFIEQWVLCTALDRVQELVISDIAVVVAVLVCQDRVDQIHQVLVAYAAMLFSTRR